MEHFFTVVSKANERCLHMWWCIYVSDVCVTVSLCYSIGMYRGNLSTSYLSTRFSPVAEDDPQVLDRPKCLAALASLRHAKWFQVRLICCMF